ncbi:hypothetical protein HK097_000497 [Rhizophlyctis rosea]|uniref:Histone H1 n=1 Tax=Rhizophlyctis rosea TaxID=64517 RepID=A0AAD5S812_9FUNG|nr:hypothetical protein HK097_000497 [Rhizophlyctis rosea]
MILQKGQPLRSLLRLREFGACDILEKNTWAAAKRIHKKHYKALPAEQQIDLDKQRDAFQKLLSSAPKVTSHINMGRKQQPGATPAVKVIYHGADSAEGQTSGMNMDYLIFANPNQIQRWRLDNSIPLVDVVDFFDIFEVANGGNAGVFSPASKQTLENAFSTSNETDIIQKILKEGKIIAGEGPYHHDKDRFDCPTAPFGNYTNGAYQGSGGSGRIEAGTTEDVNGDPMTDSTRKMPLSRSLVLQPENELEFRQPFNPPVKRTLNVRNVNPHSYLAFKIGSTAQKMYTLRPNNGDPRANFSKKDKLIITAIKISDDVLTLEGDDYITYIRDIWAKAEHDWEAGDSDAVKMIQLDIYLRTRLLAEDDITSILMQHDGVITAKVLVASLKAFVKDDEMNKSIMKELLAKLVDSTAGCITLKPEFLRYASYPISEDEKESFTQHINCVLKRDKDVGHRLPIDEKSMQVFAEVKDGLILAKLINVAVPDTINEHTLHIGSILNDVQMLENNVVVINAAKVIGCSGCFVANIGSQDIIEGREHMIWGLIWQIIKVGLQARIDIKVHPELFRLVERGATMFESGEDLEEFTQLPPEQILLRWFNYHLKKAGWNKTVKNFSADVKEGDNYTVLLNQLAPGQCSRAPLQTADLFDRAEQVLQNADKLGCRKFLTAKTLIGGNRKLHFAFVANLFDTHPGLENLSGAGRAEVDEFLQAGITSGREGGTRDESADVGTPENEVNQPQQAHDHLQQEEDNVQEEEDQEEGENDQEHGEEVQRTIPLSGGRTLVIKFNRRARRLPYRQMVIGSITALKESGHMASRQAIKKYIFANFEITNSARSESQINQAIRRGAESGEFLQPKGPNGRVLINQVFPKAVGQRKIAAAKKAKTNTNKKTTAATKNKITAAKKAAAPKATKATGLIKRKATKTSRGPAARNGELEIVFVVSFGERWG